MPEQLPKTIEMAEEGVRILLTGDQRVKAIDIDGTPNERVAKALNMAITKSQEEAARMMLELSADGFDFGSVLNLQDSQSLANLATVAEAMQRALGAKVIEVVEEGVKVVLTGDQKLKVVEIDGVSDERVVKVMNNALAQSQEGAARTLIATGMALGSSPDQS